MNNGIKFIFTFALGAAVGSVVTWKILETRYNELVEEEIESVKEVYSKHDSNEEPELVKEESKQPTSVYNDILQNYTSSLNEEKEKGSSETMYDEKPEVVSPAEFGENEDYGIISLTYFADGVLTDDQNIPINDVDDLIGEDSLTHFGEYEDDSVFVRDDRNECYYEILLDERRYSELTVED